MNKYIVISYYQDGEISGVEECYTKRDVREAREMLQNKFRNHTIRVYVMPLREVEL